MMTVIVAYIVMLVVGVGAYYGYTRLPEEFRVKVAGWKTNAVAAVIAVAPDVMQLLAHVEALSTLWEPSETVNLVLKGIAVTMVVLRYITSYEQKENL